MYATYVGQFDLQFQLGLVHCHFMYTHKNVDDIYWIEMKLTKRLMGLSCAVEISKHEPSVRLAGSSISPG